MNVKDIVKNPHWVYLKYFNYWNFLLLSYEGGVDYTGATVLSDTQVDKIGQDQTLQVYANGVKVNPSSNANSNLFSHPKEKDADHKKRIQMSYYYNFCSPIIDIYSDHLFKTAVLADFKATKTAVERRKDNIDRKGSSIIEFRKEMADLAQLYGHIYVTVDSPMVDQEINSVQDQINTDTFAYFSFVHPQNMINWALDSFGKPYWMLIRELSDANIDVHTFDAKQKDLVRYRLLTRDEWFLFDAQFEQIATGPNTLGVVPVICVFDKKSKKTPNCLGISTIADIAFIARDVYNSSSELKQILRDQTFAFLTIQGDATEYDALIIGTRKALLYPEDRDRPGYISPPSENATVYFTHIDRQVTKMFQLAKLEGGSGKMEGQSAVAQSGTSKAWDFNQTNSSLTRKAANLEDGEMKLWALFSRIETNKDFEGSVDYPREFNVKSLNEDLEEAEKTAKLEIGNEFDKEVKKSIVKKKFPRMQEKDLKVIIDEIEASQGKPNGGKLVDRLPGLFKKKDANSSGK